MWGEEAYEDGLAHQAVLVDSDAIPRQHLPKVSAGYLSSLTEHADLKIRHYI